MLSGLLRYWLNLIRLINMTIIEHNYTIFTRNAELVNCYVNRTSIIAVGNW